MFDDLELLTQRVDRLERSNRLLKIVNLVGVVAIIAITRIPITSAGPSGIINALQYNLFSRSGTLLATLGTNTSGFPSLTFFDAKGKRLTQFGEADDGKSAGFYGFDGNALLSGKGVARASLLISAGGAGESEFDGNEIQRVFSGIVADSTVDGLFLFDAKTKLRADVLQQTGGSPVLFSVYDDTGSPRAAMFEDDVHSSFGVGVLDAKTTFCRACLIYGPEFAAPTVIDEGLFLGNGSVSAANAGFIQRVDNSASFLFIDDALTGRARFSEGYSTKLPAPNTNGSFVDLFDSAGNLRISSFTTTPPAAAAVTVFDSSGKPVGSLP